MSTLIALLYVSEMRAPDAAEVGSIRIQSRANNFLDSISGLLVFDGQAFCQYVEGPAPQVAGLRDRLERDPRHRAMRVLQFCAVKKRRFAAWRLGYAFSADPAAIARVGAGSDADADAAFDRWAPGLSLTDEGA